MAHNTLIYAIVRTTNKNSLPDYQWVSIGLFCIVVRTISICKFYNMYTTLYPPPYRTVGTVYAPALFILSKLVGYIGLRPAHYPGLSVVFRRTTTEANAKPYCVWFLNIAKENFLLTY